jgi:thiol:disulfide interchange protein DsbG
MKIVRLLFALWVIASLATACSQPTDPASSSADVKPAPASPISGDKAYEAVTKRAAGFETGPKDGKTVYVLFDPQCPHCGDLWEAAKPLRDKVRMVWVPVRLLGPRSRGQGAALLAASDPLQAMDEHEKGRRADGKGIEAPTGLDASFYQKMTENTQLFVDLGQGSVPLMVWRQPLSGKTLMVTGAVLTPELQNVLGL